MVENGNTSAINLRPESNIVANTRIQLMVGVATIISAISKSESIGEVIFSQVSSDVHSWVFSLPSPPLSLVHCVLVICINQLP